MNDLVVTAVQAKWVEKLPPLRFLRSWVYLSSAMFLFFLPVAGAAYALHGGQAVVAAAVAGAVCYVGATLALLGTARFGRSGTSGPLYSLLFGMVFNGALPFSTGLILYRAGGPLAEAGVFGLIVVFFQFALIVETILSLCVVKTPR